MAEFRPERTHFMLTVLAGGPGVAKEIVAELPFTATHFTAQSAINEFNAVVAPDDIDAVVHAVKDRLQPVPLRLKLGLSLRRITLVPGFSFHLALPTQGLSGNKL
jgi:hypothetical protein